ncbi:PAS domain-containing sensor histidine kinase [Limnovirga soli]|uniref:histidine kinase n=1 Tax=Limnovirga soli TaxID=2656915 RepID=A0A8J8JWV1_9BACT|nr:PAS domain-containing sensor histidine kinase [Limnovirga soli]NNV55686.1 PAS domain S-box protein [Limnovirga soli]
MDKKTEIENPKREHLDDGGYKYEAFFSYATIGIVVANAKGEIIDFNKYAETQFGYEKNEVLGKTVEILLPGSIHDRHVKHRHQFNKAPQNRSMGAGRDLHARKKDGTDFPVEVSLSHYNVRNESYVIAFIIDISIRKSNEKLVLEQKSALEKITTEVQILNTELEQKVQERTMMLKETLAELEKSREELSETLEKEKELGDLKSRFVTMASHEFRTPLSTILTSLSLIGKYITTEDQDKRMKHIVRSKEAVSNMKNILEDFLSLGKLEEGKIHAQFALMNLKEFFETTIEDVNSLLKIGQHISYLHEGDTTIYLDNNLLKNIIINLISNAIKFSPEHSTIFVSSYVTENHIKITVKDQGIGISEEDLQHLFERFFRAKNAQNIQGTGLGLHIISKYLELLDGTINLNSELGKGTEFFIDFERKYSI